VRRGPQPVSKAAQQHRHFTDEDPAAHIEVGTARWSSVGRQAGTEDIQAARSAVDAIARLAGNQQVATYLSRVQGWPHADIAAFLGCSTSRPESTCSAARHAVSALDATEPVTLEVHMYGGFAIIAAVMAAVTGCPLLQQRSSLVGSLWLRWSARFWSS